MLALLLLLTLLTLSRRHYLDRIALEAEAKRQLEERVLERTRELENANAQLQQEVHEREQAPVSYTHLDVYKRQLWM